LADANIQMVGRHVARATAKQAIDAQYSEARKSAIAAHKLMERVRLAYHRFTVHDQQPSGRYWLEYIMPHIFTAQVCVLNN